MKTLLTNYTYRKIQNSSEYQWAVFHMADVKKVMPLSENLKKDEAKEIAEQFQITHNKCEGT